jgi:hypothetical protein
LDLLSNLGNKYVVNDYIPLDFNYDPEALVSVLDPIPKLVIPCHTKTVSQIHNLLGIDIPIQSILYFKLPPIEVSAIHIDINLSKKTKGAEFALNLPLMNSAKVLMRWYVDNDPKTNFDVFAGPNGTDTPLLPINRAICINELYYTRPHIVKINDWHSVENESTTDTAHFISLRFFSPLDIVLNRLVRGTGIEPVLTA